MRKSGKFLLSNNQSKNWADIKANTGYGVKAAAVYSFEDVSITPIGATEAAKYRVATADDFKFLMNGADRQYGYGVLYGDGATTTASDIDEVYGYTRESGVRSSKGMRGCFVYNTTTGKQLFFPIGATGYGRRKTDKEWYEGIGNGVGAGKLQYAWRIELYKDKAQLQYRPLFFDVYRRPGAIYWCNSITRDKNGNLVNKYPGKAGAFLDVNYFTFDFDIGNNEVLEGGSSDGATTTGESGESSACFIRLVEEL